MKILILQDQAAGTRRAAEMICDSVMRRPDGVLGLATGGTMEPLYAELVSRHREGRLSFARAKSFNLDEYVGLAPSHPQSYHSYMDQHLFGHVDFAPGATALPDGSAPDPHAEADAYEARIVAAGGIDLQLLGIGRNGHIGFNEPTSSLCSRTRVKTLTESTRAANARFFGPGEEPPTYAITMGLASILDAREVLLLAFGKEKAPAVRAAIEGPVSAFTPASVLQMHRHATLILDQAAASDLELREYYFTVHPDGAPAVV